MNPINLVLKNLLQKSRLAIVCVFATAAILLTTTAAANIVAPSNITGSESNGSVTLSWNSDTAATAYNIYKNNQYLTTVVANNYEETLAAGEVANYYVVAVATDPSGAAADMYSPRSEQVTLPASAVPTDTTIPPSVPSALNGTINGTVVELNWTASSDDETVSGYNIYQNNQYISTVFDTSYTGVVEQNVIYSYTVSAFDIRQNFSPVSSALTLPESANVDTTLPPSTPTNVLGSIESDATNDIVTINWDASSDDQLVLGYNVYRNNNYLTTVSDNSYSISVPSGQTNRFYIVAFDNDTNFSAQSDTVRVPESTTPIDTTIAPSKVSGLSGALTGSGSNATVALTWEASTDDQMVLGYNVYENNNYLTTVFATSYTASANADSVTSYYVVAFDADENYAPPSNPLTLPDNGTAQQDTQAPNAPANLVGSIAEANGVANLSLQWEASTDDGAVSGYNIYENNQYLTTVSDTSFAKTVTAGQTYSYYVVAFDNSQNFSQASVRVTLPEGDNRPPSFENLVDQTIFAGENWSLLLKPIDIDGGNPGMFTSSLPVGVASEDNLDGTRTLRWRPLQPDVGVYDFNVTAIDSTDSSVQTTQTVRLTVVLPDDTSTIVNLPPGIDLVEEHVIRVGDTLNLNVKATDPNGTRPELALLNQPANATFGISTDEPLFSVLRWTPTAADIGVHTFNFEATDSVDSSMTFQSSINVRVAPVADFVLPGERLRDLADQRNFKIGYASLLKYYERPDADLYQDIASQDYNLVTPENSMKWAYINPMPNEYRYDAADTLVQFANTHNMEIHGHTLVWYTALPQWVQQTPAAEREQIMFDFIDTMTSRYNTVSIWDVVNEAFEDDGTYRNSIWQQAMGKEHINKAFERARAGAPNAQLIYNDYDISWPGAKSDAAFTLMQELIASGAPIDGIGFQMHIDTNFNQFDEVAQNLQRFADLGLDIYITEFDVSIVDGGTTAQQGEIFGQITDICLAQASCKALQVWGINDRYSWRKPLDPLLLTEDYQVKPAYTAVQEALSIDTP